jgi:hypothetical protein
MAVELQSTDNFLDNSDAKHTHDPASQHNKNSALNSDDNDSEDCIVRIHNVHKTYLLGVEGVPALRGKRKYIVMLCSCTLPCIRTLL